MHQIRGYQGWKTGYVSFHNSKNTGSITCICGMCWNQVHKNTRTPQCHCFQIRCTRTREPLTVRALKSCAQEHGNPSLSGLSLQKPLIPARKILVHSKEQICRVDMRINLASLEDPNETTNTCFICCCTKYFNEDTRTWHASNARNKRL